MSKQFYAISSLDLFALNDIAHLLKNHSNLLYELDTEKDPSDALYYRDFLLKNYPQRKSILNFTGDFLEDFKNQKISDTLFERLLTFSFIRIEDTLYEVPEDKKLSFDDFFKYHFPFDFHQFSSLCFSSPEEDLEGKEADIFIFRNPKRDIFDIILLEQELKKHKSL